MPHTVSEVVKRFLTGALLTFGLGLALFALVRLDAVAKADERVTSAIHQVAVRHQSIPRIAEILTMIGNPLILAILVAVSAAILLKTRHRRVAVWLLVVTTGGAIIETGLKLLIRRTRPDLKNVFLEAHGTSFPSGHAMNTTIVLGAVALTLSQATARTPGANKVLLALAVTVSIVVAATRVLIGVHYLNDVIVGLLLALFWLALCHGSLLGPNPPPSGGDKSTLTVTK